MRMLRYRYEIFYFEYVHCLYTGKIKMFMKYITLYLLKKSIELDAFSPYYKTSYGQVSIQTIMSLYILIAYYIDSNINTVYILKLDFKVS